MVRVGAGWGGELAVWSVGRLAGGAIQGSARELLESRQAGPQGLSKLQWSVHRTPFPARASIQTLSRPGAELEHIANRQAEIHGSRARHACGVCASSKKSS